MPRSLVTGDDDPDVKPDEEEEEDEDNVEANLPKISDLSLELSGDAPKLSDSELPSKFSAKRGSLMMLVGAPLVADLAPPPRSTTTTTAAVAKPDGMKSE